jgi:hypothetical protein
MVTSLGDIGCDRIIAPFLPLPVQPKISRNVYLMESIDLTDGFDVKRITPKLGVACRLNNSIGLGSIFSLGDRIGIQLPYSDERRLKLFIVGWI